MRRRYVTNLRFQASFTFAFIAGIVFSVAVPAVLLFATVHLLGSDPALTAQQRQILSDGLNNLMGLTLACVGGLVVLFGAMGGYLSYKFAGPLARLEAWITARLSEQDATPLRLRTGDELLGVADLLNRIMGKGRS